MRAAARTTASSLKLHEVFERAAAAGDNQHVRPQHGSVRGKRVEAVDRRDNLGRGGLSLHPDRPNDDPEREAVGEPVKDVANDRAGGRRHHADDFEAGTGFLLRFGVE